MKDHIVIIEDDHGHAELIESNLRDAGITNSIVRFSNGYDALDALHSKDGNVDSPLLALLDLNMPGMPGTQVLEALRADPRTKALPVIILTTSANSTDIATCYELGCNLYLTKPIRYEDFVKAIRTLGMVFKLVKLPNTAA